MAFLRYSIDIVGQEKVRAAMRAIESEVLASNRRTVARATSAGRTVSTRARTTVDREQQRAHEKAEREKTKTTEREARLRAAAELRESKRVDRERAQADKRRIHAFLAQQKLEEREARRTQASQERAALSLQRQRSSALMAQYRAEERSRASVARAQERADMRGRAEYTRGIKGVLGGTVSRVGSVARGGVALTGLAGGAIAGAAVHGAMAKSAAAADLANQLLGNNASAESLKAKRNEILTTVAGTRGFAAQDVIAGMSKFQGTAGEGAATLKMAPILTKTSLATGANMEDLGDMYASMYAAIRNSSGGATKSVDQIIEEVERLGRVFGAMGQIGAIELKDVAAVGSEITAAAIGYSGNITENIQKVGAMMQIAKQTGGAGGKGGAEASTAVQNFANDLVNKKDEVQQYITSIGGGSMFADKGRTKLKSLDVLLPELMAATGGDLVKMGDILNVRGTRGLKGFTEPYQEAYQKAKAGGASEKDAREAGKKAVSARFGQFAGIEMTKGEVDAKAEFRLGEADKQLEEQMRKLTSAVGAELLPTVTQMIPEIAKLVPLFVSGARAFADFIRVFASNPLSGVGVIIGAAFAAEIGKAAVGNAINSAIASSVDSVGASSALTKALGSLAIGTAAFSITTATLNILGSMTQKAGERAGANLTTTWQEYGTKKAEIMTGPGTAQEKAQALGELAKSTGGNVTNIQESIGGLPKYLGAAAGAVGSIAGPLAGYAASKGAEWLFGSETAKGAESGAAQFQAQLLKDQATAADMLAKAATNLQQITSNVSINTGSSPTMPAVK